MYQNFPTFRRNTHVTQKHSEYYLDKIQNLISYNIKLRNKNSYKLYAMTIIGNNPIYLNILSSTSVRIIESKKANFRTQRQENWR